MTKQIDFHFACYSARDGGEVLKRSNRGSAAGPRCRHGHVGEHGTGGRKGEETEGLCGVPSYKEGELRIGAGLMC